MDRPIGFVLTYRIVWLLTGIVLTCIVLPVRYLLYYGNAFEKDKPLWRDKE